MFATLPNKTPDQNMTKKGSCKKCQELYTLLNNHVLSDHEGMSGSNSILNNILLNILSLLIDTPALSNPIQMSATETERQTVISKPKEMTQKVLLVADSISPSQGRYLPASSTAQGNYQTATSVQNSFIVPALSPEYSSQQTPELTTKLAFQPDLISNLFNSTNHSNKTDFSSSNPRSMESQQSSKILPISNLEVPFMLQTGASTDTTNLIGADGNLTPAGISLLLANQQRTGGSGKSDLDVADILVNKMPIPSLNKGLDASLLQTLYLQQVAQGNLMSSAINIAPATSSITGMTSDLNNLIKSINSATSTPEQIKRNVFVEKNGNNQNVSLQQLIQKHRQISDQLMEAMNNKQKGKVTSVIATPEPVSVSSQTFTSTSIDNTTTNISRKDQQKTYAFPISPQVIRKSSISSADLSQSVISKPQNVKKLFIDIDNSNEAMSHKQPVMLENYTSDSLVNFFKSSNPAILPKTDNHTSDVQFLRQKSDVIPASLIQKGMLGNLVIGSTQSKPNLVNASKKESDSSRKRPYSSVTMVPISEYNPLDPSHEPLPTRVSSPTSKTKVLYKCETCGVTFSVLATLESHMKSHVDTKVEQCSYCNLKFTDQQKYFEHLTSHRGEENVVRCNFCPKIFTSKGDYTKHLTKHTQRRPYVCSHCQKAFKDPGSLTKHERIHTGEQPYICTECNRGFAEKSSLRKHMRVHSGEKPYKCEECDKSFSISGNLQRHLFIHTGAKPFKCTQCSKAFNNPSHLRRHVKNLHQNAKSYGSTKVVEKKEQP